MGDPKPHPVPTLRWLLPLWLACLALGIILRFVWPTDMEWKADEIFSVEQSRAILATGDWPTSGMSTSVGLPNPGLSLWAFVPLVAIGRSPIGTCRLVMLLNTLALLGFAAHAVRRSDPASSGHALTTHPQPPTHSEAWLWATAFLAVNPYAVRIARKIWPPSLLMPLMLVFTIGYSARHKRWGAFAWGLAGILMTQIHLSAAFLTAGAALLSLIPQLRGRALQPNRWAWRLAGTALGAIPLFPWFIALRDRSGPPPILGWSLESFYLRITLFYQYAFELALGLTTRFSHGSDQLSYLTGPAFLGKPTHAIALCHLALGTLGAGALATWLARIALVRLPRALRFSTRAALRDFRRWWVRELPAPCKQPFQSAWMLCRKLIFPSSRHPILATPETRDLLALATLAGPALLILACRIIYMHYVYIFLPYLFFALTTICARRRRLIAVIVILQAALACATLLDIHQQGGTLTGDYGRSYHAQGLSPR